MRWYNLRQSKEGSSDGTSKLTGAKAAEVTAGSQFVSVSPSSLTFGLGRHACPGRFFAANEIKMICAVLLMNYDVALPEGESERYENLTFGHTVRRILLTMLCLAVPNMLTLLLPTVLARPQEAVAYEEAVETRAQLGHSALKVGL